MCYCATGIMQNWVIFAKIVFTFCVLDSVIVPAVSVGFFFPFSLFPKLSCSISLLKLPLYYILEMGKVTMVGRLNLNLL